jgi:uncharacterized membrane protein
MKYIKTLGWVVMTALAALIAWYAFTIFLTPSDRNPLVANLLANHPYAAPAHFIGGAIALLTGALQLNATLRTRFIALHRWLGRSYLFAVLAGSVAGLILAPGSFGGLVAQWGFGLLAVVWFVSTLLAYRSIRSRDVSAHRAWMIRSYALTLAAVTLRLYMPASQALDISMDIAYPAIAWLCWAPNLFVAEWFIRSKFAFSTPAAVEARAAS